MPEILSNVADEVFVGSVRGVPSDWQINNKEPLGGLFLSFHQPSLRSQIQVDAHGDPWPISGFGWGVMT